jgi:hypothetical protein
MSGLSLPTGQAGLSKSFYIARKPTNRFRQAQPDKIFIDAFMILNGSY